MPLPVQFATTSDGARIAYVVEGEGPPLLFVRGWITHLELMWEEPRFRRFFEALTQRFRVVRFDARGNGLSQRAVGPPELDAFVRDVEAVVDACALGKFVLWGSSFGGPIAIAYAARTPERVARLVLEGTYPTWTDLRPPEQRRAALDLVNMLRNSPGAAAIAASYMTDPEPESRHEARASRVIRSIDPDYLALLYVFAGIVDVHDETCALQVPTLVMHSAHSQVYPAEGARLLASEIAGARYVELPGRHHNPWEGDADAALDAMCSFCDVAPVYVSAAATDTATAGLTVVMFTDIVGSTELAERIGDAAAAAVRREHETIVTETARLHGGTVVKFTGDGALVRFASASAALATAQEIIAGVRGRVHIRIGMNLGEPIAEAGDLHGTAVNLAARVCAAAEPDEVFVTGAVRHLARGKSFTFADRGPHALKGFADDVHLYALVSPSES